MRVRILLLIAVWIVAIVVGIGSWKRVQRQRAVDALCAAVEAGDWDAALANGDDLVATDERGLEAARCRGQALMASGDLEGGVALFDALLADPAARGWFPEPFFLVTVIVKRRLEGRLPEAAELARRAAAHFPDSRELLRLELEVRSELEDEETVLEELARRVDAAGQRGTPLGQLLAASFLDRDLPQRAADMLGAAPPAGERGAVMEWYRMRATLAARLGDAAELAETCRQWVQAGGQPAQVLAWHALNLSTYQLADRDYPTEQMLDAALARKDEIGDPVIVKALYNRLIDALLFRGLHQKALGVLEEAGRLFDFPPSRREEILGAADRRLRPGGPEAARRGVLRFTVSETVTGGVLLVSPDPAAGLDADYEPIALESGSADVERSLATAPGRWVYRDGQGRTLASGAAWPTAAGAVTVGIEPRAPSAPSAYEPAQRPADGRRRIYTVILDCGDWHVVQYLRARGELPVTDVLLARGWRAVVESTPPFTAAAMNHLVFPGERGTPSALGVISGLGEELAGNPFIEANPFAALRWLLPESPSLFETIGAGERVALNLLHSAGKMKVGRHGERVGPHGRVERFTQWRSRRRLADAEWALLPEMQRQGLIVSRFEETAALFDAAESAAEEGKTDLLLLRLYPLDLATHTAYADISRTAQDDGQHEIYFLYRYIDRRLGHLYDKLDGDDVLIAMSDHGILNSAEHDPRCFFIAAGGQTVAGRVPGTPHLRGVPRLLADLLGVETDWPRTGIETWAAHLPEASP